MTHIIGNLMPFFSTTNDGFDEVMEKHCFQGNGN